MAPNLRVAKAFRAMKDIGITEEITKPVLKKLIKVYDKNWELIEAENYRVLADAIFDSQESEVVEQKEKLDEELEKKKQLEQAQKMKAIEEETQIQEELERPLNRLRPRHQEGSSSPSSINSPNSNKPLLIKPKQEADEVVLEPISPLKRKRKQLLLANDSSQVEGNDVFHSEDVIVADETGSHPAIIRLRDKGKSPLSPQREKRSVKSSDVHFKEPKNEPGVNVNGTKRKSVAMIIPKDEPNLDYSPPPLAVIMPESLTNGDVLTDNNQDLSNNIEETSDEPTETVDIASSSSGEIKISLSFEKTKFLDSNVDTLLKTIEDKCLKSYKLLDPNFSLKKLMKDMCESFIELGSNSTPTNEPPLAAIDVITPPPIEPSGTFGNDEVNGIENIENTESFGYVIDIAKGQESVIISLVNEVNNEYPPSFHYIPKNAIFQNAYVNFSLSCITEENCCPTCYGDCMTSSTPCPCALQSGGEFAYTTQGLVKEELLEESIKMIRDPQKRVVSYCKECPLEKSKNEEILEQCKGHLERSFIKECYLKCGCNKKCGNRVVQCGIKHKLQVFMTSGGKGWGVRTLEDLPKGAFVCEYVGEVLTNSELYNRIAQSSKKDEYAHPVVLDADWGGESGLKDEEALCLDATYYGNVARFINHRCFDSNLVEIPVEVENPDRHYYHLAFFTTRKVKALEELTRDYCIDFDDDDHPVKAFRCQCGSRFCRDKKPATRSRKRRLS